MTSVNTDDIIQLIQERGYRLTSARKKVIGILANHSEFLGAYDIHHLLEQENTHIGVASIYRVLDLLKSLGLLKSEEFGAGGEKYRLENKHSHHHHSHQLICSQCGHTEELLGECPISHIADKLEQDSGYQIEEHWLRFFGVCPLCRDQ
ncbi:Fe2+/Zn2+ uptake regulation protein [Desulfitobacterium dichloroeliminans LMG P-21439]|uniref:Fe2+/Zn2+ uptake regulation protein n=1 Tax=Desulfitobacterium dichloroeliminans (strain LMG P-21439 / DCA1) TaxID=871963 RepID=L0F946_DESDL|nr:transcriptional repressor [Desulfitobacterium dichloroeliminans]AGA69520.1 Fe2+/Zn2+ uptake regulation protein [Desulfitobacterium dichloroeliminans LMG P-21439]